MDAKHSELVTAHRQTRRLQHVLTLIGRWEETGAMLQHIVGRDFPFPSSDAVLHRLDAEIETIRRTEALLADVADALMATQLEARTERRRHERVLAAAG